MNESHDNFLESSYDIFSSQSYDNFPDQSYDNSGIESHDIFLFQVGEPAPTHLSADAIETLAALPMPEAPVAAALVLPEFEPPGFLDTDAFCLRPPKGSEDWVIS